MIVKLDQKYPIAKIPLTIEGWIFLLLPFVLLLFNPSLFVSNPFHSKVDSWIYYGYFQNLPQHLQMFTNHHGYFGDRLAFIIPGYLINKVFQPWWADFILHLAYYYTALFSLYALLKLLFGRRVAVLTTLLFGCYYYNLWMLSWNVIDGVSNVYFLLTMLFFARTAKGHQRWCSAVLAGCFFACMGYTSVHALKLAPGMAVFFAVMLFFSWRDQVNSLKQVLYLILVCGAGTLLVSGVFSLINYQLTGDFHVLRQSIEFAKWLYEVYQAPREISKEEVLKAYWLILPILLTFGILTIVGLRASGKRIPNERIVLLCCAVFFVLILPFYLTTIKSAQFGIFLVGPCQFAYLNGGLFITAGALLSTVSDRLSSRGFAFVSGFAAIILASALTIVRPAESDRPVGPAIIANAMAAIQEADPNGRAHFIFEAPGKDLMNRCGNPNFTVSGSQDYLVELYHNIASTYLWEQAARLLSHRVDEITNPWALQNLRRSDRIVLLTEDDSDVLLSQKALGKYGISTEVAGMRLIQEKGVQFKVVFLAIR